eukprot:scaffold1146_cov399-Prasinococcus_capsulatus_cf.AAC.7
MPAVEGPRERSLHLHLTRWAARLGPPNADGRLASATTARERLPGPPAVPWHAGSRCRGLRPGFADSVRK